MCECGVTRFCVYINWKVQAYRPRGWMAMTCCCLHSIGLLGNHISWMEIRWLLLGRCLASNESVDVDNVMMGSFVYMVLRPLIAFSSPCFFFFRWTWIRVHINDDGILLSAEDIGRRAQLRVSYAFCNGNGFRCAINLEWPVIHKMFNRDTNLAHFRNRGFMHFIPINATMYHQTPFRFDACNTLNIQFSYYCF